MRIKEEVQEAFPDLIFMNSQPPSQSYISSPQHDDHDPRIVDSRRGEMAMILENVGKFDTEVMDEEKEAGLMEEEDEERRLDIDNTDRRKSYSSYEEENSREQEKRSFATEEDESNMDKTSTDTEVELEHQAMHRKSEREQAEDWRSEHGLKLENGYSVRGDNYNSLSHYVPLSTTFSPHDTMDKEERHHSFSNGHHFLGQSLEDEHEDENSLSKHSASYGNGRRNSDIQDTASVEARRGADHRADPSVRRPFVIQLSESGPVFPAIFCQTKTSHMPSLDTTLPVDA